MAKKKNDKDLTKAQMPKAKPDIINKDIVKEEKQPQVGVPDTQLANLPRDELMTELYRRGYTVDDIRNKRVNKGSELEALVTSKEFNKGGSLAKQMEMFEEGGLKDEGGSVDPISGNDVPIGSTKEEVRDDIPAQLSEGEFVFPADVVRFIGLEKLMMMRQEAKAGLKRMEDMGQMGNSEEATLPDDMPFTMDDLDIDEEDTQSNFNQGGVVSMAEGGTTPTTENTDLNKNDSVVNPIPQQRTMIQQKPLNVRQQNVPIRGMVTNIPKTSDFLKKKTTEVKMPSSFLDVAPKDLGSRYTGKFTSKLAEVEKSADDVKQEIDSITSMTYDDNQSDSSSGVKSGGIDYSSVDRFSLDDDLRDVFNDFSKSQLSMFGVLTSSPFSLAASGIGLQLGKATGGKSAEGPIYTAELGKIKSTAFHQAALDIQKQYGLLGVSNINNWSQEAKTELARQGRVAMDFANDVFNASVGKPYSSFSFNEKDSKSFTEKAKGIVDSIRNFGKTEVDMTYMSPSERAEKEKKAQNLWSFVKDVAKQSLVTTANKQMLDTVKGSISVDDFGVTPDLNNLGFNNDAQGDIAANGGSIGIGQNSNGTTYSINENGSYTHSDGTTTNVTDSKGNPINAPEPPSAKPPAPPPSRPAPPPPPPPPPPSNDNNDNNGGGGLDDSSSDYSDNGMGGWT